MTVCECGADAGEGATTERRCGGAGVSGSEAIAAWGARNTLDLLAFPVPMYRSSHFSYVTLTHCIESNFL
jgi:hypothetical protein